MSPSVRMKLLCCLATILMTAGVMFFQYNDRVVINSIAQQRLQEKGNTLDELLRLKSAPLVKLVTDYASRDTAAPFIQEGRPIAGRNAARAILETYGADVFWLLDGSGTPLLASTRYGDIKEFERIIRELAPRLAGRDIPSRLFYAVDGKNVLELGIASVARSDNAQRNGSSSGYLVVGQKLNATYFREIEHLTLSTVELADARQPLPHYDERDPVLTRHLQDFNGTAIIQLRLHTRLGEVATLKRHNIIHLSVGMLLVLLFVVTSARVIRHQGELARAKFNMDGAQRLAGIGSWERDLTNGKGYWSENCYHMMAMTPQPAAPSLDEFILHVHEDDRARVRENLDRAAASGDYGEIEFHPAHDPRRMYCSTGTVLCGDDGKPKSMVGSIQDITEKRQQETLREQLLKQREEFITRLSHDLKTPLTPLVALLPLIQKHATSDKVRDWATLCIKSIEHMKELVVKTIKLARYSSPARLQLKPSDIALSAVVDEYIGKRLDVVAAKGISIENRIAAGIQVFADQIELEEVFYNLITNAVKYSPTGSRVTIDAISDAGTVTISVSDQGIGLSGEEIPHIFDEFFKADPSRHELDSSGLGLSICKRIVENHGGRIWADSAGAGQGTTIRFTIAAGGAA